MENSHVLAYPAAIFKHFPDYVPEPIRKDYEESCAIKNLSPKAAATLARRCLQGMIHDFWNISEKNLNAEIDRLKPLVPASQWKAIDATRQIRNIGAHMEKDTNLMVDITADEANLLVNLIELLIDKWYVAKHDEEQLYNDIVHLNVDKQEQRRSQPSS
jgi:hypothetical protein